MELFIVTTFPHLTEALFIQNIQVQTDIQKQSA